MRKKNLGLFLGITAVSAASVLALTSCGKKSVDFKSYGNEVTASEFEAKTSALKFASEKSYSADVMLYSELNSKSDGASGSIEAYFAGSEKIDFENMVAYTSLEMSGSIEGTGVESESVDEKFEITAQMKDDHTFAIANMNDKEYVEVTSMYSLAEYFRAANLNSAYSSAYRQALSSGDDSSDVKYYVDGDVYTFTANGSAELAGVSGEVEITFQVQLNETSAFIGLQLESSYSSSYGSMDTYTACSYSVSYGKQEVSKVDLSGYKKIDKFDYTNPFDFI